MSLVTLNEVLPEAREKGIAIAAFNIANYETAKAVMIAAEKENQPIILQVYHRLMEDKYIGALAAMMRHMAENSSVPVVVHLDHGASFDQIKLAIECGFTSVMFDGSQLEFKDNMDQTAKAAEYAHKHGVSIEAEIGHVPFGDTDGELPLSTPKEAIEFVNGTKVDALALAIGTSHGYYRTEPKIDVELAQAISEKVSIPLVLHGGSGTPPDKVAAVIKTGFAKVNVATEFQHACQLSLESELKALNKKFLPLDKIMVPVVEECVELLRKHIRMFSGN
jgi:fructose-bisphosphate aldolase, class II